MSTLLNRFGVHFGSWVATERTEQRGPHTSNGTSVLAFQNSDNPAVQLQGPFLQDRLIPPPAHRNIVMIAAGTGVNPSEGLWVSLLSR